MARLFPYYANESPFLVDMLNPYFLGGIDDMATWTRYIWKDVIYMLENGVQYANFILTFSPILIGNYFLGALAYQGMCVLRKICFRRTCELPHNTLFIHCNTSEHPKVNQSSGKREVNGYFTEPNINRLWKGAIAKKHTNRGIFLQPSANYQVDSKIWFFLFAHIYKRQLGVKSNAYIVF